MEGVIKLKKKFTIVIDGKPYRGKVVYDNRNHGSWSAIRLYQLIPFTILGMQCHWHKKITKDATWYGGYKKGLKLSDYYDVETIRDYCVRAIKHKENVIDKTHVNFIDENN